MDYLTRLFLELKEAERTAPPLPRITELAPGTGTRRPAETAEKPAFTPPGEAARTRQEAVRQLHRLFEQAQAANRLVRQHDAAAKHRASSVPLQQPLVADTAAFSSSRTPEPDSSLSAEAFSRFFERDARRYG